MIRMTRVGLAVLCLVLASSPGAIAQNLKQAHLLPGTPVVGPAVGAQQRPAMAAGAGQTLLLFEDTRAGDGDVFGVRLGTGGVPMDVVPFAITKGPGTQTSPKAAWNGQNWLVAYSNQIDPGSGYFAYQFAAVRVSPQGTALDATPIVIGPDNSGGDFGIASDGTNWVVLYTDSSTGNNVITAKRISPAGVVLDPAGVTVFLTPSVYGLAASFGFNEYVFTWQDLGLRARRFDAQLQPLEAAPVLLPYPQESVMGFNGSHFLIAWPRQTPIFTQEIVANRLNAALASVDLNPIGVSGYAPDVLHNDPKVVWDGTNWIVSWLTWATAARAARITAAGVVLDPGGVAIPDNNPTYLYHPALGALPGGGGLVAWDDIRFGPPSLYDVFGTSFSASGTPGTEQCFSVGAEALTKPRVAGGSQQYLLTFRAESASGSRILAQRLDAAGNAIDSEPIQVAAASHTGLFAGRAAWNGALYLVTWSDSQLGTIFSRRLLADATWIDSAPIPVMPGGSADVAALGSDFLVVGRRAPASPQYVFAYGARVRGSDGAVLDNPALSMGPPSYAAGVRVQALGSQWLVATERHFSHNDNSSDIELSFVDAMGAVSPPFVAGYLNIQSWGTIGLASSGTSAMVVSQTGSNWTNTDVYARRILPNGSMPAPLFNVTGAIGLGQAVPSVCWTGAEYVIGYQTFENNVWSYDYEPDLYATRISEGGVLLDPMGFAMWNGEDYEVSIDGAGLGGGLAVFAASTYVDGAYAAPRIAVRGFRPAGISSFGAGTPGCEGPERMEAGSRPFIGNAAFTLLCTRAPANASGLLAASNVADVPGSDPLSAGILLHVGLLAPASFLLFPMGSDQAGLGTLSVAVPPDATLIGATFYAQAAFLWGSACQPSPLGLSTSDGLAIQIQAP